MVIRLIPSGPTILGDGASSDGGVLPLLGERPLFSHLQSETALVLKNP